MAIKDPSASVMSNALAQKARSHPNLESSTPEPTPRKRGAVRRLTKVAVPTAEVKRTRLMSVNLPNEILANIMKAHYPGINKDLLVRVTPEGTNLQWEEE